MRLRKIAEMLTSISTGCPVVDSYVHSIAEELLIYAEDIESEVPKPCLSALSTLVSRLSAERATPQDIANLIRLLNCAVAPLRAVLK